MNKKFLQVIILLVLSCCPSFAAIEAEQNGTVYGNAEGLARVESLEAKLATMTIKETHPRIHITDDLLATMRSRAVAGNAAWTAILSAASGTTNYIDAAAASLVLHTSDPSAAATHATNVYARIMADSSTGTTAASKWALAFDWAYNDLSSVQRDGIANKISANMTWAGQSGLANAYEWTAAGGKIQEETFYVQTWATVEGTPFWSVIALAGHNTSSYLSATGRQMGDDAAYLYKNIWNYDTIYGDILRFHAYTSDYVPTEGYWLGSRGLGFFMDLRSATNGGIDVVFGQDGGYQNIGDYQMYAWDFYYNRNVFHKGVSPQGAGGVTAFSDTTYPLGVDSGVDHYIQGKPNDAFSAGFLLKSASNPYHNWMLNSGQAIDYNYQGNRSYGSMIMGNFSQYIEPSELTNVVNLMYRDDSLVQSDPRFATYQQLPYAKKFSGAKEVYMRSSFGANAVIACLRNTPILTKSSHGDFDSNTFLIYRRGNLAMDSGVYDDGVGGHNAQSNYFGYQKNSTAHNNIMIIDPAAVNAPLKIPIYGHLYGAPDPGGVNRISNKTFGMPWGTQKYLHTANSDGGQINRFETRETFDYASSDSTQYGPYYDVSAASNRGSRASEVNRSTIFIRKPDDKAYFIIFDRINATSSSFQKKWLIHAVNEPTDMGSVVSTEVADHIVNYSGHTFKTTNSIAADGTTTPTYNNSGLYGTILLPSSPNIRKVGGDFGSGYEYYVDGIPPQNFPIELPYQANDPYGGKGWYMGGDPHLVGGINIMKETGTWRLELTNNSPSQRDHFLVSMFIGDDDETPSATVSAICSEATRHVVHIEDATKNEIVVLNKSVMGSSIDTFSYSYTPTTPTTEHIITEIAPLTQVSVTLEGAEISGSPFLSSDQGIVSFSSTNEIGIEGTFSISTAAQPQTLSPTSYRIPGGVQYGIVQQN